MVVVVVVVVQQSGMLNDPRSTSAECSKALALPEWNAKRPSQYLSGYSKTLAVPSAGEGRGGGGEKEEEEEGG